MPWVNRVGYSPGKRHYYTGELVEAEPRPDYRPGYVMIGQRMSGKALCGMVAVGNRIAREDGSKAWTHWGTLSIRESVNLNQRNLCSYCVRKYVREVRPDLLPAYETMKMGATT